MKLPFVVRTHYQVCEPAYIQFLVKLCTSPSEGAYRDAVARRLADEIRRRCQSVVTSDEAKTHNDDVDTVQGFNAAASDYALDLAHGLQVLTANNMWAPNGQLVDLIAKVSEPGMPDQLSLTTQEKVLQLRLFLEGDGAALLFLAEYFARGGALEALYSERVNGLAQEMFLSAFTQFYELAQSTAERVELRRQVDRFRQPFKGKTGVHKLRLRIQTFYRLGLLNRTDGAYRPTRGGEPFRILREQLPSVHALYEAIRSNRLIGISGRVLGLEQNDAKTPDRHVLLPLIAHFYKRQVAYGTPFADMNVLFDAAEICLLSEHGLSIDHGMLRDLILGLQAENPKDISFHVDRSGTPAYVKISREALESFVARQLSA